MKHLTTNEVFQIIDGSLANGDKSRLIAHLDQCEKCRREVEYHRTLEQAVRRIPMQKPTEGFTARVLNRVVPDRRKSWTTRIINNLGSIMAMALVLTIVWYALNSPSASKASSSPSASSVVYSTYLEYYAKVRAFASAEFGKLLGERRKEPEAGAEKTITLTVISILILIGVDRLVARRVIKIRS